MFNIDIKYQPDCVNNVKQVLAEIRNYLFDTNETNLCFYSVYSIADLLSNNNDVAAVGRNFSSSLRVCDMILDQIIDDEKTMKNFLGALDSLFIKRIENRLALLDYVIIDIRSYISQNEPIIFKNIFLRSKVHRTKTIHSSIIINSALNMLIAKEENDFFESVPISLFLIRQYMDIRIKELLFGNNHHAGNKIDIKPGLQKLEQQGKLSSEQSSNLIRILKIINDYAHHGILPYYWIAYEIGKYTNDVMSNIFA